MRDFYAGTAAALRDALRNSVERGGASSLGVLHPGVPSAATLTGDSAIAQAGCIRRQLDRLPEVPRALLVVAYAPRDVACNCHAPCCSGRYPNPEWRAAFVANLLTRTHDEQASASRNAAVYIAIRSRTIRRYWKRL